MLVVAPLTAGRFVASWGGKGFVGFVSERGEGDIEKIIYPVMQALQSKRLASALNGLMPKVGKNSSPFDFSNMKSARCGQSEWKRWGHLLRNEGCNLEEFRILDKLTPDEAWALDFCIGDNLEKPESILL